MDSSLVEYKVCLTNVHFPKDSGDKTILGHDTTRKKRTVSGSLPGMCKLAFHCRQGSTLGTSLGSDGTEAIQIRRYVATER